MALRGREGVVEGIDYRGVPVVAALRAVQGTPWKLVAKIDLKEVNAPLQRRAGMVLVIVLLAVAVAGGSMALLWRHQQAQLYQQRYEVERAHSEELKRSEASQQEARRQAEESLALFRTNNENAPVGFAFLDASFRYVHINQTMADINGIAREDHIGRTVEELLPLVWPHVEGLFRGILASGKPVVTVEISGETKARPGERPGPARRVTGWPAITRCISAGTSQPGSDSS
jgi:PAS domain-containing protein